MASAWSPPRVSEERAREELEEARSWVEGLIGSDQAFRDAIGETSLDYVLVHDYDTGSVALYRLVGNRIERA